MYDPIQTKILDRQNQGKMGMEGGSEIYPFSLLALSHHAELLAPKEVVKTLSSPLVVPLGGHTSEAVFLRAASV